MHNVLFLINSTQSLQHSSGALSLLMFLTVDYNNDGTGRPLVNVMGIFTCRYEEYNE